MKTCEFVTPKHPDKICDLIADSILDAYLVSDRNSRVAVEVMGGHNQISVSGEIRSNTNVDIAAIVKKIVGENFQVNVHVVPQSSFIAAGVDLGGAGDQGIMIGYALNQTPNFMPLEYELARNLCERIYDKHPFDGKVQVTVEGTKVITVVASFQNIKSDELLSLVKTLLPAENYLINPAGDWSIGGFDADSGISGRKIVIDNYGPEYSVGGGSFSGKDFTKVDRSGAYMARKIAVDFLKKKSAQSVQVKLAYAIGKSVPVMAQALIEGHEESITGYDLSPEGIRKFLLLDQIRFAHTATWGHFGRGFNWDL
ncbi:MAG: hypothetical protein A3I07_01470 [Candidatus Doudnabacteria bacterium RIFCSPLOWO2_02_FULL_42_9]|uniref:methionine adenosyltransferase n=1 Tax=Candidatus Doudnabacteria bacterium RIFCSPHIGHO2_01_FULL_41_86 TaxID=1817821 RepID=A0A1F5N9D3_9BACT|nr:MAG: hypothetical protein A2717_01375 [Candidatus Doudnabacteria bacterium RIFCSPHIGHO2_01_FULL_41_86]OGE74876.1 MAG: hypothetical protein A3K07_02945 [Candidatus Doudnabacteria bacterium RIFCSPHIGHO2_01_43_10]OGE85221.1 MAG: hypothetical protein A3E28_00940 [Candidatus Doudnabacteria bacterium RIFCSPHIGHO2_12_FULL_42_22]OGE86759.1 MAG: hypothetical protein A3C49_01775 [Candidatus Doudnabacteria bacterium RIFCSPHIGHO2_02_FULL_42_25]OGE92357.1 MAG: hypothetical protein A2895_01930 [Candidatus